MYIYRFFFHKTTYIIQLFLGLIEMREKCPECFESYIKIELLKGKVSDFEVNFTAFKYWSELMHKAAESFECRMLTAESNKRIMEYTLGETLKQSEILKDRMDGLVEENLKLIEANLQLHEQLKILRQNFNDLFDHINTFETQTQTAFSIIESGNKLYCFSVDFQYVDSFTDKAYNK